MLIQDIRLADARDELFAMRIGAVPFDEEKYSELQYEKRELLIPSTLLF